MRVFVGLLVLGCFSVWVRSDVIPARPHSLLIHGEAWSVVEAEKMEGGVAGRTSCNAHMILVRKGQSTQDYADTVLHEAQHAFTCEDGKVHNEKFNNDDETGSHDGIYWATNQRKHFIADNPGFIVFVEQAGK